MITIVKKKKVEKILKNCGFIWFYITKNILVCRMYGNKKLHPIGYYIPILIILK
jgi:hypothetical protein